MVNNCKTCGNHEDEKQCRKCGRCNKEHMMKYGVGWTKTRSTEPCQHICRFQLPSKKWIKYQCTKHEGHEGQCNFPVNARMVEKIARDSIP